ncbi:phage integrase Arm DNA-binding domain-containing protein [Pantoea sp. T14]|uniref:phage integrase central domain-containing protein n=1 Tax=Pantoea sp. T14 TaxID=3085685 RepID=UPI002FC5CC07
MWILGKARWRESPPIRNRPKGKSAGEAKECLNGRNATTANLPRNLTYRKIRQSCYWRNPVTGQEISLGRISREEAVSQVIEANSYIEENYLPSALFDLLKEAPIFTFSKWLKRYSVILDRRILKPGTMKIRSNQLSTLQAEFGRQAMEDISTRHIAMFLETYVECGKRSMAVALRSCLLDVFREAVVEGVIERNPVEPTKTPRQRLSVRDYRSMTFWRSVRLQPQ